MILTHRTQEDKARGFRCSQLADEKDRLVVHISEYCSTPSSDFLRQQAVHAEIARLVNTYPALEKERDEYLDRAVTAEGNSHY